MVAENGVEHEFGGSWVDNHVATYRYAYPWSALLLPIIGLVALPLVWQSAAAFSVWMVAEAFFGLAAVRWSTYRVEFARGSVCARWAFHRKTVQLAEVDLIQELIGDHGKLLRIRHGDRILLTLSSDLEGFDDLVGFFREYARRHQLLFATRDYFGEWTQQSGKKQL